MITKTYEIDKLEDVLKFEYELLKFCLHFKISSLFFVESTNNTYTFIIDSVKETLIEKFIYNYGRS